MMGALFGYEGFAPFGAGGAYHRQTSRPCQLYGSRTYPTTGAVNEHRFTCYTFRPLK
jgi:hypothetical protein